MQTITLVGADAALTLALQTAVAKHDFILQTATATDDRTGPLIVRDAGALQCHSQSRATPAMTLPLPVRLGTVIDWLLRQRQRIPALDLGPHGRLELQTRQLVPKQGAPLALTEKEAGIIACLARATAPVPRDQLMAMVWGYSPEAETHTLETHIYRLRQKLDGAGIAPLIATGEEGYTIAEA